MLLHIARRSGYGTTLLGLHFYTWSFIAFVALIAFCVLMLSADRKWGDSMLKQVPLAGWLVMALFFVIVLVNLGGTTLEAYGFGPCRTIRQAISGWIR